MKRLAHCAAGTAFAVLAVCAVIAVADAPSDDDRIGGAVFEPSALFLFAR